MKTLQELESIVKKCIIFVAIVICSYSILYSLTVILWGDPSVHGHPQLLHPPVIVALQIADTISPALAAPILVHVLGGIGIVMIYLGFRQLTKKNSLDNPVRKNIRDYISSHPGHHFRSIMRETGINRGTLYYHLLQLKLLGIIREVNDGGLTRYYVHLDGRSLLEQKIITHQDNPLRDQILITLQENGPVMRSVLKKDLGISGPALWYHMKLLINDGIVTAEQVKEDVGKPLRYSLTHNAADLLKLNSGNTDIFALEKPISFTATPVANYFTSDSITKTKDEIKAR